MAYKKNVSSQKKLEASIALLRILSGGYFAFMAWQKWQDPIFAAKLSSQLSFWAYGNPFFIYQDFLNGLVIPNTWLFAQVILWLEILIATSYISGAIVQVFCLLQIFLNTNYLLALGHTSEEMLTINITFLVLGILFYINDAGQYFGLDRWLPWRVKMINWRLQLVR